jgi:hypothetical protein
MPPQYWAVALPTGQTLEQPLDLARNQAAGRGWSAANAASRFCDFPIRIEPS